MNLFPLTILATAPFALAQSSILFSEIDLSSNTIELVNTGSFSIDLSNHWWCNRVNGSPFYQTVGSATTIISNSSNVNNFEIAAGGILVLQLGAGFLPDANGELGLFSSSAFSSSAAIVDYVLWGDGNSTGVRDSVAQQAGLWVDNEAIDVTLLGSDQTIQLADLTQGNRASDYSFGSANFGAVPEPSAALLGVMALPALLRRRR